MYLHSLFNQHHHQLQYLMQLVDKFLSSIHFVFFVSAIMMLASIIPSVINEMEIRIKSELSDVLNTVMKGLR